MSNAADERANKPDTEEALKDPSKSTTSACQAPRAHLHQEAQGKLYIKALGKAEQDLRDTSKGGSVTRRHGSNEGSTSASGRPLHGASQTVVRQDPEQPGGARLLPVRRGPRTTQCILWQDIHGSGRPPIRQTPGPPEETRRDRLQGVLSFDVRVQKASCQQLFTHTVADGEELCSGCGYAKHGTGPGGVQPSESLSIQGEFTDSMHSHGEWTISGKPLLLASGSTTASTACIQKPLKDLLPNAEELNNRRTCYPAARTRKKRSCRSSNEEHVQSTLPTLRCDTYSWAQSATEWASVTLHLQLHFVVTSPSSHQGLSFCLSCFWCIHHFVMFPVSLRAFLFYVVCCLECLVHYQTSSVP